MKLEEAVLDKGRIGHGRRENALPQEKGPLRRERVLGSPYDGRPLTCSVINSGLFHIKQIIAATRGAGQPQRCS
jgi:hypothetical protein